MQLILGDCCRHIKRVDSESINLILTDPPYGGIIGEAWDKNNYVFSEELVKQFHRVLKHNGSVYVWCGMGEKSRSLMDFFPLLNKHFWFKDLITWKKRRGIGMRKGWLYTREEILWFVKNKDDFVWNKEYQYSAEPNQFKKGMSGTKVNENKRLTNVWTDVPEQLVNKNKHHLTEKPLAALSRIILAHTQPGDTVFDPFMGGGSTGKAALNLGREFIGIEIDPKYYKEAGEWLSE